MTPPLKSSAKLGHEDVVPVKVRNLLPSGIVTGYAISVKVFINYPISPAQTLSMI